MCALPKADECLDRDHILLRLCAQVEVPGQGLANPSLLVKALLKTASLASAQNVGCCLVTPEQIGQLDSRFSNRANFFQPGNTFGVQHTTSALCIAKP